MLGFNCEVDSVSALKWVGLCLTCPFCLWCQLNAGHQALVSGFGPTTHSFMAWGPQSARSLIKSSAWGTQAERGPLEKRTLFRVVFMCRKRRTRWEFVRMDTKGQVMSAVGSSRKSVRPVHTKLLVTLSAHIHQALVRRAIPLARWRRALPVVGLVPRGAKWRQGNPIGSPKLSLLVSWN